MTTKKASVAVRPRGKGKIKTQTLVLTPQMVLGGLKRLGTVCEYVESQMRKEHETRPVQKSLNQVQSTLTCDQPASLAPLQLPSAEKMAEELRSLAHETARQAEAIRARLVSGTEINPANPAAVTRQSNGPLKDHLDETRECLFDIRRDLDTINAYAIGL